MRWGRRGNIVRLYIVWGYAYEIFPEGCAHVVLSRFVPKNKYLRIDLELEKDRHYPRNLQAFPPYSTIPTTVAYTALVSRAIARKRHGTMSKEDGGRAVKLKDEGNVFFKEGNFKDALGKYSQGTHFELKLID
jgi:hypothetical protein